MMKLRMARPGFLIDINRIPGLLSDPTKVATCVPGGRAFWSMIAGLSGRKSKILIYPTGVRSVQKVEVL